MDHATRLKIEKRAYELFLARGGVHGYHMEDWAKAEKETLAGTAPKPAAQAFSAPLSQQKQMKKKGRAF